MNILLHNWVISKNLEPFFLAGVLNLCLSLVGVWSHDSVIILTRTSSIWSVASIEGTAAGRCHYQAVSMSGRSASLVWWCKSNLFSLLVTFSCLQDAHYHDWSLVGKSSGSPTITRKFHLLQLKNYTSLVEELGMNSKSLQDTQI